LLQIHLILLHHETKMEDEPSLSMWQPRANHNLFAVIGKSVDSRARRKILIVILGAGDVPPIYAKETSRNYCQTEANQLQSTGINIA
jgi:hypothetical protein